MISNYHLTIIWEDQLQEKVFIPMVPSIDDVIVTPKRIGLVDSRRINATKGTITIYANSQYENRYERNNH